MLKLVSRFFVIFLMTTAVYAIPQPKDWSQNEWYQYFEAAACTAAGEAPGAVASKFGGVTAAPVMEVYSALSGISSAMEPALLTWLQGRMLQANDANDLRRMDLYQAYYTALANRDKSRLLKLLKENESRQRAEQGPVADLAGSWRGSNGWYYNLTAAGPNTYTWALTSPGSERGEIQLDGTSVKARWNGFNGSGTASGTVKFDSNGRAHRIEWSNGINFKRR